MPITFDWSKTISELPGNPIPAEWLATKGAGVKVAFIDTGANLGLASFSHLGNMPGRKFFTGADTFSVSKLTGQDMVGEAFSTGGRGHGTLYFSLLAGKTPIPPPPDKDLVNGLANAAEYYIIKARNPNDKKTTIKNLLAALELSANLGIEIAITGQCISASEMPFEGFSADEVERVFSLDGVKKMLIFAPLKNLETTDSWEGIVADNIPSLRPEVFNVAKFPDNFEAVEAVLKSQNISFLLSGFSGELLSKTDDADAMDFSNSGAVTILGGIAVLAASFFKTQHGGAMPDKVRMQQLLGNHFQSLDNALGNFSKPAFFKNF